MASTLLALPTVSQEPGGEPASVLLQFRADASSEYVVVVVVNGQIHEPKNAKKVQPPIFTGQRNQVVDVEVVESILGVHRGAAA